MSIPPGLVSQFCSVTNATESVASRLLQDNGLDLHHAISSFFAIQEAGGGVPTSPENTNPPIASTIRNLLNHNHNRSSRWEETVLNSPPTPSDPFIASNNSPQSSLANLFRRPTHLIFSGSFREAMEVATTRKLWLLVNIQRPDVFACQTLNRDVWADTAVEQLIHSHFLFWQRDDSTEDASHYRRFYTYSEPPHIALLDPRSGESLCTWGGDGMDISKQTFLTSLQDFLTRNNFDSDFTVVDSTQPSAPSSSVVNNPQPANVPDVFQDAPENSMQDEVIEVSRNTRSRNTRSQNTRAARRGNIAEVLNEVDRNQRSRSRSTASGDSDEYSEQPSAYERAAMLERQASSRHSLADPALIHNRSLRAEQDNAFEESLALDRAMEASRRSEAERVETAAREEAQRSIQLAERREQKRKRVPDAPPKEVKEGVRELMIRLPNGRRLQRRFFATDKVGSVYDFVETEVEGLGEGAFELVQAFPKKSFVDRSLSLDILPAKAALVVGFKD